MILTNGLKSIKRLKPILFMYFSFPNKTNKTLGNFDGYMEETKSYFSIEKFRL